MINFGQYKEKTRNTLLQLYMFHYFIREEDSEQRYNEIVIDFQYLIENATEAKMIIRSMLNSPAPDEVKEAEGFLREIYKYSAYVLKFYDPNFLFFQFYGCWQNILSAIELIAPPAPLPLTLKKITKGSKPLFKLRCFMNAETINQLWSLVEGKFITGDKQDFFALCLGVKPEGVLKNTTNRGSERKSNATVVDLLFYLGYSVADMKTHLDNPTSEVKDSIKEALKTYFGYNPKSATESLNPTKYNYINEMNDKHLARREMRHIFSELKR